jgi:hypothetical protein
MGNAGGRIVSPRQSAAVDSRSCTAKAVRLQAKADALYDCIVATKATAIVGVRRSNS